MPNISKLSFGYQNYNMTFTQTLEVLLYSCKIKQKRLY